MELHQLRYFIAVVEQAGFTRAATKCAVSQPSLSLALRKLEAELGGPLLERGRKAPRLTARGEAFLPRAREALQALDLGRASIAALAGLTQGRVTLGCLPTTGAILLPPVLAAFRGRYPGIQVRLVEESSPGLAKLLAQGEADLAILDDAGLRPGLEGATLFTEDLRLCLPPGHVLAGARAVRLKQVAHEGVVLMKEGHGFRQITLAAFARAGVNPRVVFESGEIGTVQALVAAGLGVSLVPAMVARPELGGPAYADLAPPRPSRTMSLAWRRRVQLSEAVLALRETCISILKLPPRRRP